MFLSFCALGHTSLHIIVIIFPLGWAGIIAADEPRPTKPLVAVTVGGLHKGEVHESEGVDWSKMGWVME